MLSVKQRFQNFVNKSQEKFGLDFVKYHESTYVNSGTKCKFTCIKHDIDYMQTPRKSFIWL